MKTLAFLTAALLSAGMLLTSCQKGDSVLPDNSLEQTVNAQNAVTNAKPAPDHDDILVDPIRNYPDPFTKKTMISYVIHKPTKISLIVYNEQNVRVAILASGFLPEGAYRVEFDATELRPGKYFARLNVGNTTFVEEMTKVYDIDDILPSDF